MALTSSIIIFFLCCTYVITDSIPITLQDSDKTAKMKFRLQLPTNETVVIKLSFTLLTPSKPLPLYDPHIPLEQFLLNATNNETRSFDEFSEVEEFISAELTTSTTTSIIGEIPNETHLPSQKTVELTTSTTTSIIGEIPNETHLPSQKTVEENNELNLVTVEEAIESFRQDLVKKEMEISGIVESEYPFYRHFRLEYSDGVVLPIRCTYTAVFKEHSLTISCYEYRELGIHRILSNGEIETSEALTYIPEYINARNVKQTYSMTIT